MSRNFKEFLKENNGKFKDPILNDFSNDAIVDKSFRDFQSWDELETYLIFSRACSGAMKAGKKCWKIWRLIDDSLGN